MRFLLASLCALTLGLLTPVTAGDDSTAGVGPSYTITNLTSGQIAFFTVDGATPGGLVLIGYSTRGAGPTQTPYGMVAMTPPISTLATLIADSVGNVTYTPFVPNYPGVTLYTQAYDATAGNLTNALVETIQ